MKSLDELGRIWAEHNVEELLEKKYEQQIRIWFTGETFSWVEVEAANWDEEGNTKFVNYIGSVMSVFPSGKYYTAWTTNQTNRDVLQDGCFRTAFEKVLSEHNMWLENGEGDPTDLFICKSEDEESEESEENGG